MSIKPQQSSFQISSNHFLYYRGWNSCPVCNEETIKTGMFSPFHRGNRGSWIWSTWPTQLWRQEIWMVCLTSRSCFCCNSRVFYMSSDAWWPKGAGFPQSQWGCISPCPPSLSTLLTASQGLPVSSALLHVDDTAVSAFNWWPLLSRAWLSSSE